MRVSDDEEEEEEEDEDEDEEEEEDEEERVERELEEKAIKKTCSMIRANERRRVKAKFQVGVQDCLHACSDWSTSHSLDAGSGLGRFRMLCHSSS